MTSPPFSRLVASGARAHRTDGHGALVSSGIRRRPTLRRAWTQRRNECLLERAAMDTVYPASVSALVRGRRVRRACADGAAPRLRRRTAPVTFAEIKEVDEENEETEVSEERRRKPDVLEEQFTEFRRRRARRHALRERDHESPPAPPERTLAAPLARAGSEPAALHHRDTAATDT